MARSDRDRDRDILSEPGRRRSWIPTVQLDSETFGRFAEWVARFMGTATFLVYMTVFVIVWVLINLIGNALKYSSKAEFDYLVKQGILTANPKTEFGVNKEITRIEAAEILAKALKLALKEQKSK